MAVMGGSPWPSVTKPMSRREGGASHFMAPPFVMGISGYSANWRSSETDLEGAGRALWGWHRAKGKPHSPFRQWGTIRRSPFAGKAPQCQLCWRCRQAFYGAKVGGSGLSACGDGLRESRQECQRQPTSRIPRIVKTLLSLSIVQ